jgi:HEAT repeat protein
MKALSPRAAELLADLRGAPTFVEMLKGRDERDVAVLTRLASDPEPAIVRHLLPFLVGVRPPVMFAAADVVRRAIDVSSADDLLDLDEECRKASYGGEWGDDWARIKPIDVARFENLGTSEVAVVGVASFHANGYVREAAVSRLDAIERHAELPFLLIRINDWVEAVAARASAAIERRLVPAYAVPFLEQLPMIERLGLRQRRDNGEWIARVYDLLQRPEQREVLLRGLLSTDRQTRRLCFRLALPSAGDDRHAIVRRALAEVDTVIRLEAVGAVRRSGDPRELHELLPVLLADRYPRVRGDALLVAVDENAPDAVRYLSDALLDTNRVVREVARFYLKRSGAVGDFPAVYRAHLGSADSPRRIVAALAGLAESGSRADAEEILPYSNDRSPAVRRAAIRALSALDGDERLGVLVAALDDPSAGVSRAARDAMRRRVGRVAGDIRRVFAAGSHAHARRYALTLLADLGKWDTLPYLLEAAADTDEEIRDLAQKRLSLWITSQNSGMAPPTRTQLETIREALERHGDRIAAEVIAAVRGILRFW